MKRMFCILVIFAILLSLAACRSKEQVGKERLSEDANELLGASGSKHYAIIDSFSLEHDLNNSIEKSYGDMIYVYSDNWELVGEEPDFYVEYSYRRIDIWDKETGTLTEKWSDSGSSVGISDFALDDSGNIWLAESTSSYTDAQRTTREFESSIYKLAADGSFKSVDFEFIKPLGISQVEVCNGFLYFKCGNDDKNAIYTVVPERGELISVLPVQPSDSFTISGEGSLCLINSVDKYLGLADFDEGDTISLPIPVINFNCVFAGDDMSSLYLSDGSNLYGYDIETGKSEKLLNWISVGVQRDFMRALGGGRFLARLKAGSYVILAEDDSPRDDGVVILTMATSGPAAHIPSPMAAMAAKFNSSHEKIKIEVLDYSVYDDGILRLNTEIIAGQVPDIFDMNVIDTSSFVSKGLFEDLYGFIDNDPELSRSDFFENILDAYAINGKLYELPLIFTANTYAGFTDVVGTESLGMEQFIALSENMEYPFGKSLAFVFRELFLENLVRMNCNRLIDLENAVCHFDSDMFREILKLAMRYPKYGEENTLDEWNGYEALRNGEQLLIDREVYDIFTIRMLRSIFGGYDFSAVGLPGDDAALTVYGSMLLGISTSCKNKEAAWEVLRFFISEEYQIENFTYANTPTVPINRSAFEVKCAAELAEENSLKAEGKKHTLWAMGPVIDAEYRPEEDLAVLREILDKKAVVNRWNEGLFKSIIQIVIEDASAYFDGARTADETARIIQARAQICISEGQ